MRKSLILFHLAVAVITGCSTLPSIHHKEYDFPSDEAFFGNITKPYETMGLVRSKVNFNSLDYSRDEADLCSNYFNKAVLDLVKTARDKGGDAVIDVKSVVFFEDGKHQLYTTPECSDDGVEGQALAQGIAVKWKKQ